MVDIKETNWYVTANTLAPNYTCTRTLPCADMGGGGKETIPLKLKTTINFCLLASK
jgi:hypothetical protein